MYQGKKIEQGIIIQILDTYVQSEKYSYLYIYVSVL